MNKKDEKNPLRQAADDARYLLAHGYPRERVLALVGDRYALDASNRHVLRRGVFAPEKAKARRERLLSLPELSGKMVGVDGHNVLITLETALSGGRLVLADDGVVRDIAALGRNHRPDAGTLEAAGRMLGTLANAGAAGVLIRLESKLPKSGELAENLRRLLAEKNLAGDASAVPVPEKDLVNHSGPVATSDSALIDQVNEPVDLAGLIIVGLDPPPFLERLL